VAAEVDRAQRQAPGDWSSCTTPQCLAPLAALGILLFISTWNEYFWPLIVTRRIFALYLVLQRQVIDAFIRSGLR
jgi:sn-glycerol 3-phosphate transport system permease protein